MEKHWRRNNQILEVESKLGKKNTPKNWILKPENEELENNELAAQRIFRNGCPGREGLSEIPLRAKYLWGLFSSGNVRD